ncbi:cell division cycle 5-like protein [Tanacetum coccineum]
MNLPTPQIPDYELQHIAKFGLPALSELLSEGSGATTALLADLYTNTTPMEWRPYFEHPMSNPAGEARCLLLMEAENQAQDRLTHHHYLGTRNKNCPLFKVDESDASIVPLHAEHADQLIKEEAKVLRVAMGHEDEDIDEFVEAHKTCLNDIMYFPTREAYGLSSVAGNAEKLAAFQKEFDTVKKRMDNDTKKAVRLEQKIKLLTNGYQMRAAKIWSQVEATFKQMDTAGTEYECFQALKRQEQLAASNHISSQEDSAVVEKVNDESSNGQMDGPSEALHINDQDAGLSQSQQIDATEVSVQAPMEILAVDSGAPESNIEADATRTVAANTEINEPNTNSDEPKIQQ